VRAISHHRAHTREHLIRRTGCVARWRPLRTGVDNRCMQDGTQHQGTPRPRARYAPTPEPLVIRGIWNQHPATAAGYGDQSRPDGRVNAHSPKPVGFRQGHGVTRKGLGSAAMSLHGAHICIGLHCTGLSTTLTPVTPEFSDSPAGLVGPLRWPFNRRRCPATLRCDQGRLPCRLWNATTVRSKTDKNPPRLRRRCVLSQSAYRLACSPGERRRIAVGR
jgi:hypothetical protein